MKKYCILILTMFSCSLGAATSSLQGIVTDGAGQPMDEVSVQAKQTEPIKGYELLQTTSAPSGTFNISGLYPLSKYQLVVTDGPWESAPPRIEIESGPKGETKLLAAPLEVRYMLLGDVVRDTKTGLEWLPGPEKLTQVQAEVWVSRAGAAAGGWRMPTKEELSTLYIEGHGEWNRDPSLKAGGYWIWAESRDEATAWRACFLVGNTRWSYAMKNDDYIKNTVFAVRTIMK